MARIRTVKPELWTDPEFTECSLSARLLFIALLNFATDFGVLPDKPRQIKMQCLPADDVAVDPLIDELIEQQFLIRRTAPNGEKVLVIRTFTKNQVINRPSKGRWGDPDKWDNPQPPDETDSVNDHGDLTEASPPEGKGRDNSERETSPPSETSARWTPDTLAGEVGKIYARHQARHGDVKSITKLACWKATELTTDEPELLHRLCALNAARIDLDLTPVSGEAAFEILVNGRDNYLDAYERDLTGPPRANPTDELGPIHGPPPPKLTAAERMAVLREAGAPERFIGQDGAA